MPQHTLPRRRRLSVGTGTAALSLGLCLCAGQLMTATAANAATTPVTQAAAVKITPKVNDSVNTSVVTHGKRVRITAKVINPKTGKVITSGKVRVQAWRNHKWNNWANTKIGKDGYARIYETPGISGYFRTEFYGNSAYKVAYGKRLYVKVNAVNKGSKILAEAKKHTGALYKFAAAGPKRFDCSGFTKYVYKKAIGKSLPHKANSQQHYGKSVSKSHKAIGDLIIFRSGSYGYHAGIYAGHGYMYDSPHTGARVGKHKMYGSNYVVRRLV